MPRLPSGCVVTCRQALTKGALLCKHFRCKVTLLLGEHWPRGSTGRRPVRKKRPAKRVFFSGSHFASDGPSRSGLTDFSPHSNIYLSIYLSVYLSIANTLQAVKRAGRIARAWVGHMPRHTIPTCPNASMCGRKVSLAKRSSERLNLNFEILLVRTFQSFTFI